MNDCLFILLRELFFSLLYEEKIILAVSLICLLSLIAILAITKYKDLSSTQKNPIKAIPTNASIIIKSDDWRKSWDEIEASDIWQKISSTENWKH